jgi:phage-related protein
MKPRKAIWIGDSKKRLKEFPEEVQDEIGYALQKVQEGLTPRSAKPLKGFSPAVMEIVCDYDTNTFRAVYTVKIGDLVYILHCFQKKSKHGIKTPKQEIDLIKQRLREAELINKS